MNILVTGGAGFIGSHICDRLVADGHRVVAVDNLMLGRVENISHLTGHTNFSFIEMDLLDLKFLGEIFREHEFDCVFHMAANSDIGRSHASPTVDFSNTFQTTYCVLEMMRQENVQQIVFASSSAVYGEVPGCIQENHGPLLPISHYGAAKLSSEAFISSYGENYGIRSWIARFPNVVGDRSTHGVIYDFVNKLKRQPHQLQVLGDGNQVKPYLHVSDLVDALVLAWVKMADRINYFNIGGTTRTTVRKIAEIVVEESGTAADIVYTGGLRGWVGDVPAVDLDTAKIRALGWDPKLNSDDAVHAAAQWMFGTRS
jgi:UDP-glucose 4-epimerase